MKKKNLLTLDDDFIKYCALNQIADPEALAKKIFQRGFTIEKYGETPSLLKGKETVIEKQVEIIKEVPVEKIVEVIKEVPVEIKGDAQVVVKEVVVEKLIDDYESKNLIITLTEANRKLQEEINKLTEDLNKIATSLGGFNKAKYMKGSDLSNLYDE